MAGEDNFEIGEQENITGVEGNNKRGIGFEEIRVDELDESLKKVK